MQSATPSQRRRLLRAGAIALCLLGVPFAALADDDAAAGPPVAASVPVPSVAAAPDARAPATLMNAMSAKVQSAADVVIQSAHDVTGQALDLIGVRYRFGGQTPEKGLDCSGLVKYVFEQVTGVSMPRSAREQAKVGEQVDREDLQPGDLVFFNTRRAAFSHVGIYLGDNEFVHAPRKKSSVRVANLDRQYWKKRFNGARRLLGIMPGMVSIEAAKAVLQALPQSDDEADGK